MPDEARNNIEAIFLEPLEPATSRRDLTPRAITEEALDEPGPRFTPFNQHDLRASARLASELGQIANAAPDARSGLADASARAREIAADNPGLARHAFGLFATHHPRGKGAPIPSVLRRLVVAATREALPDVETSLGSGSTGDERKLDWYREDPLSNEHHEHWHWVYPNAEIDDPERDPRNVKRRHGELFYYMHQQMLARYDAERIAVGLSTVVPIDDYHAPLGAGYDPGKLRTAVGFGRRDADEVMLDYVVPGFRMTVEQLSTYGTNLKAAAQARRLGPSTDPLELDGHAGSSQLGDEAEPTPNRRYGPLYGNHHGGGHICIMSASEPHPDGVMGATEAAIRDPVFWRWHRHIDDIHFSYQDQLASHSFDDAPPVRITNLAVAAEPQDWKDLDQPVRAAAIETALTAEGPAELRTAMRDGVFGLLDDQGKFAYRYLTHEPFLVAIELENEGTIPLPVTLRLFLLPDELFSPDTDLSVDRQARRFGIELDKVKLDTPVGRSLHARAGREMSVIRRPAVADPAEVLDVTSGTAETTECTCGWPFTLLLPRGTAEGMEFSLFAMVTDNRLDRVIPAKSCGSMSFCGAGDEYPDARPMGYPFDRPIAGTLDSLVSDHQSMRLAPLSIRWTNPDAGDQK
jgi:hypothetical protein